MKQHITTEQLDFELNDKGKAKLRSWWKPKIGDLYIWHDGWSEKNGFNWTINVVDEEDEAIDGLIWIDGDKTPKYPLLSIGQMIEFLKEQGSFGMEEVEKSNGTNIKTIWELDSINEWIHIGEKEELCDSLWEAVKDVLKNVNVIEIEVKNDINKIKTKINGGTWGKPFYYGKLGKIISKE